jgi:pSer/pThr/pTyr-binding forkhead associated (FHA) protein
MPNLLAQTGPLAGQRFQVDTEIIVGRVTGDVVLSDPKVSSRHARFRARDDGGLEVEDLGSTNGTHVDGARIDGVTALPDGETVRIGTTEFTVTLDRLDATVAEPVPPDDDRTVIESDGASPERSAPEPSSGAGGATVIRPRRAAHPAEPIVAVQRDQHTVGPAPAPAGAAPAAQLAAVGAFSPPQARRGGLASRSWVPVVLSYGSVILAAAALIVYFAAR